MTVSEALANGRRTLEDAGIGDAAFSCALLIEDATGINRARQLAEPDLVLTDAQADRFEEFLSGRRQRIPLAHLSGRQEFMGLSFRVTPDVLIPRWDTETLVEETMQELHDGMRLLDLCTGSGCVALSLLHYSNDTTALATDLSDKALLIAAENANALGLEERIQFLETDLYPASDERFDVITANPPYIRTAVVETLEPEVRDHDPRMALDGGEDGLSFYRRITAQAGRYLKSGGWLLVEIGYDQGEAVCRLFEEAGFHGTELVKDLSGSDRVVKGCLY